QVAAAPGPPLPLPDPPPEPCPYIVARLRTPAATINENFLMSPPVLNMQCSLGFSRTHPQIRGQPHLSNYRWYRPKAGPQALGLQKMRFRNGVLISGFVAAEA